MKLVKVTFSIVEKNPSNKIKRDYYKRRQLRVLINLKNGFSMKTVLNFHIFASPPPHVSATDF